MNGLTSHGLPRRQHPLVEYVRLIGREHKNRRCLEVWLVKSDDELNAIHIGHVDVGDDEIISASSAKSRAAVAPGFAVTR